MRSDKDSDNLWANTARVEFGASALLDDITADVLVVGGGFTGCCAALQLAKSGAGVCLLEARTVGYGGSGRNVGLVNAGLWLEPDRIERILGSAAGVRLNETLALGPTQVFSLIEEHGIDCGATRTGTLHCAHSESGLADLRERLRQYRARDWNVDLLDSNETALKTGTSRYCGALWDHRAGTIQPMAYVRGLAKAAMDSGARIFEMSPVTEIVCKNGQWVAATENGSVRADAVVLATNAYHQGLRHDAQPDYTPVNFFQVATTPIDDEIVGSILAEGQGAWDTMKVMSSFRVDAECRFVLGSVGSLDGFGRQVHCAWARRRLEEMYPAISDSKFEFAWSGRIAMTSDHLPRIVKFGERALSIYGYSGRGIGPGTVFGTSVAKYLLSGNGDDLPLEPVGAHRELLSKFKQIGYELGATGYHLTVSRGAR